MLGLRETRWTVAPQAMLSRERQLQLERPLPPELLHLLQRTGLLSLDELLRMYVELSTLRLQTFLVIVALK